MEDARSEASSGGVGGANSTEPPRLKSTCEGCVRAKVKCSGPPGPCDRCRGWRHLDCVFVEERKRGRPRLHHSDSSEALGKPEETAAGDRQTSKAPRVMEDVNRGTASEAPLGGVRRKTSQQTPFEPTLKVGRNAKLTCQTSDCWSQVLSTNEAGLVSELAVSPSQGLKPDQAKIVGIFFDLYKNHASNRSCCKAWFSRQLNKIATMLKQAGSVQALYSLIEWMNRHHIVVSQARLPETHAFSDPDSGFLLAPMTSMKGPLLKDSIRVASSSANMTLPESNDASATCSCLRLKYSKDELCTVDTSARFVQMFGRDAAFFSKFLTTLCGGILPWGLDVLSTIMARPYDAVLLIRMLAHEFMSQPRPNQPNSPVVRQVQTSHLWSCRRSDGSVIECVVRLFHLERVSLEGVEVEVAAQFEPCPLLPPMACTFPSASSAPLPASSSSSSSNEEPHSGEDATLNDEEEDFEAFRFFPPALQHAQSTGVESIAQQQTTSNNDNSAASGPMSGGDAWLEDLLQWVDDDAPGPV